MARTESKVTVNNFVGGLVSDYHELNSPPNTTVDELNCDLDRKGSRKRRLGVDFEEGFEDISVTISTSDWPTQYTGAFEWKAVNEDGTQNFLVTQSGNTLSFFNMNQATLSAGEMPFTINLDNFRTLGYYTTAPYGTTMASGKGFLFVVGEAIDPFYVIYDPVTNNITSTKITIKVRDLELQDHSLAFDDLPLTVNDAQLYDLLNQGWYASVSAAVKDAGSTLLGDVLNPINALGPQAKNDWSVRPVLPYYVSQSGNYPPKSKSWWVGKIVSVSTGIQDFNTVNYNSVWVGSTLAPLGSFILEFFHQDRTGAASAAIGDTGLQVPNLPVVTTIGRPTSVAFMAGRVFYGFKNKILFSQVLHDDLTVVGNCYQTADPTAEKINDLVATDGGTITITDAATILAFQVFENAIFVFTTNGVWALTGATMGEGFSAISFSLYKVTESGALSSRSVVSVLGTPVWWGKDGIYRLISDPAKQGYSSDNILQKKEGYGLQLFYNSIPPLSKLYATGTYDHIKKVITWIYNSTNSAIGNNPYVCDMVLNYDTILQAFYLYKFSTVSGGNTPYVTDVFDTLDIVVNVNDDIVIDELSHTVVNEALETVTVDINSFDNASNTTSSIKFLTYYLS